MSNLQSIYYNTFNNVIIDKNTCKRTSLTCYLYFCTGGKKATGKGKGGGGSGRGVRGVDFGMGIGYNPESANTPSQSAPSRSAAVSALKMGMMSKFRSNFVAATSDSQNQCSNNTSNAYATKRPALAGFVSGGSIGGEISRPQPASSFNPAPMLGGNASSENSRENRSEKNSERLISEFIPSHHLIQW